MVSDGKKESWLWEEGSGGRVGDRTDFLLRRREFVCATECEQWKEVCKLR